MAKITAYSAISSVQQDDVLVVVDVHDTSMAASGTTKKMTLAQLLQPYQFRPEGYGGKGDGRRVIDAATTTGGSSNFTSATAAFTAGDVGKVAYIVGAGAAGADLTTTIAAFVNSTTVTLTATPGTAVSSKFALIGTDDTAAIQDAVNAAGTYAAANDGYAEILFRAVIYVVNGAAVIGGTPDTNAQITLPLVATTAPKTTLVFKGSGIDTLPHWQQTTPEMSGTTLACTRLDGTNDATYGPAFVIAGPYNGYGGPGGLYNNMCTVIDGVRICPPFNATFGGFGFYGQAQARVLSGSYMPMAIVPASGPAPKFDQSNISNQWSYGLQMPVAGNNDLCDVLYWTGYGATYGFMPSEHTVFESVRCNYCIIGIEAYGSANPFHGMRGKYASVEVCSQALGFNNVAGNPIRLDIETLDTENIVNYIVYDPNNYGGGYIGFRCDANSTGQGYLSSGVINGGVNLRVVNLGESPGTLSSPQAPPSSGSPWVNGYYRDAWITLSTSGGTVTALSIDSTAQNVAAGAVQQFFLASGHSYTPTYTGVLSHTVMLI